MARKRARKKPGGEPLRSFGDLQRARGGERQEPGGKAPRSGDRGFTLESADGEPRGTADLSATGGPERGLHEVLASRPRAFGPMLHGPPAYRDPESDEMQLLASFRVRTVFPADVQAEMQSLPRDPRPADCAGRADLRQETIFTIDGEDAKDFDDAIGIRALSDGSLEVGVHIADVAHYVRPGTALDAEALARATSVYLPDQVVPMLPEELSNHLCSLVPRRDRLAYSVRMVFDAQGRRTHHEVQKSVIRSVQRCTYRGVQELLDGKQTPAAEELRFLAEPLRLFQRWTKTQQELRDARGSLRVQGSARKFVFGPDGEVQGVVDDPRWFSNALIEETALAANQAVGDAFRTRGLPTIYRVHPEKDPEEIAKVAKLLEEHGIRVPDKERLTGRDVGRLIRAARKRPNATALIQRIMGLVERAYYEVKGGADAAAVAHHFGLAREAYLHFTSPIRRYPDLLVHRWLWAVESRGAEARAELLATELVHDLNQIAAHCSLRAEMAEMTEFAVGDLKVCQLVEPHVGETHAALVERVAQAGLTVLLKELNVSAFLPTRVLGDRPNVEGSTLTVRVGRRSLAFTEGHPIRVRIRDVDFVRLQVLLELG